MAEGFFVAGKTVARIQLQFRKMCAAMSAIRSRPLYSWIPKSSALFGNLTSERMIKAVPVWIRKERANGRLT